MQGHHPSKQPVEEQQQQAALVGGEGAATDQEKVKETEAEMTGDEVSRIPDANACASSSSSSNSLR